MLHKITAQGIAVSLSSVTEMYLAESCSSVTKETAVSAVLFSIEAHWGWYVKVQALEMQQRNWQLPLAGSF